MPKIHKNIIRQLFSLLLILLLGYLIFKAMIPFMSGLLGAITLYILLKKWMRNLVLNRKWRPGWAAAFLMFLSFVGILIPVGLTVMMLSSKISTAASKTTDVLQVITDQISVVENSLGFDISSSIDSEKIGSVITNLLESLVGNTFNSFIAISIMYFLLYYMLVNRKQFIESMYTYLPLRPENISAIGSEIYSIVKSNAVGIPMVAVLQGFVALIGFWVLGVPNPWFWFTITTIGSMIPFVGTAIGVVPVVILLLASGQNWEAVAMLIYGIVVVGSTDNLFRLFVQKRLADIHPLITLIGVIIGIPVFGFMGLIFGPLLISLFLLMLKIYKKEFVDEEEES